MNRITAMTAAAIALVHLSAFATPALAQKLTVATVSNPLTTLGVGSSFSIESTIWNDSPADFTNSSGTGAFVAVMLQDAAGAQQALPGGNSAIGALGSGARVVINSTVIIPINTPSSPAPGTQFTVKVCVSLPGGPTHCTPAPKKIGITPRARTLRVTTDGSGTVNRSPQGTADCGAGCSSYSPSPPPSAVTLKAFPASNFGFTGWSQACSGAGQSCDVQLSPGNTNVTATFNRVAIGVTVTVLKAGAGSGTIAVGNATVGTLLTACGTSCSVPVPVGGGVDFHAVPSPITITLPGGGTASGPPSRFTGWGGDCAGGGLLNPYRIASPTSDLNCTAGFAGP